MAEEPFPHECCGILLGRWTRDRREVVRLEALNRQRTPGSAPQPLSHFAGDHSARRPGRAGGWPGRDRVLSLRTPMRPRAPRSSTRHARPATRTSSFQSRRGWLRRSLLDTSQAADPDTIVTTTEIAWPSRSRPRPAPLHGRPGRGQCAGRDRRRGAGAPTNIRPCGTTSTTTRASSGASSTSTERRGHPLSAEGADAVGHRHRQHHPVGRRRRARDHRRIPPHGAAVPALTDDEVKRYSRHLIMPEVGVDGQRRLKAGSVLCIGAGGLGSPARDVSRRPASARSGSSTSTSSTSATCSGRSYRTATSGGRSSTSREIALRDLNPHVHVADLRDALDLRERARAVRAVRRHPRRHRQLSDALSRERRVRAARASRTPTAASSASKGRRRSSRPRTARATAACIRSRRRPGSCRAAPRAACSACCPASSASSRRPRRSS